MAYQAILFDLLSALLDSWSLWDAIAGSQEAGRRWRGEYLRITYRTGAYRPYTDLVAEAAEAAGLSRKLAGELDERYVELEPWPEARQTLRTLASTGIPLAVVTNCSDRLGRLAAARLEVGFATVVTAERAGFYKPDARPYQLALAELRLPAEECLFVAGSPWDLPGATNVGLPVFWHNRLGMKRPPECPTPLREEASLHLLPEQVSR